MSAQCDRCAYALPVGAGRCPRCGALVEAPSWFRRWWGKLRQRLTYRQSSAGSTGFEASVPVTVNRRESVTVVDETAGTTREYQSVDDLPPALRAKLEEARGSGKLAPTTEIVIEGPDGVRCTYRSLDEVPQPYRDLLARVRK